MKMDFIARCTAYPAKLLLILLVPACSIAPSPREKAASYHRSLPAITSAGGDFGTITDSSLSLTLNQQLLWAQARQQCDQKPVAYRLKDPQTANAIEQKKREVERMCRRPEDFFACALSKTQLKNLAEVTTRVRYEQDCYMTAPSADLTGKLQLRAVDKNSSSTSYSIAPIVATASLTQEAKPETLSLPGNIGSSQCLVLTDTQGTPVKVRDGVGDSYTFATPKMREARNREALRERIKDAEIEVRKQQTLADTSLARLLERPGAMRNVATNTYMCDRPARRPLPPEPRGGLSLAAAKQQAEGYCFEKLANNFNDRLVFSYVQAAEEDQYFSSYEAYSANKNSCTRKAYEYDPSEIQAMRMVSALNPREYEKRQVINLLNACTNAVSQRCAPQFVTWYREVERIEAEPKQLYEACSEGLNSFNAASNKLRDLSDKLVRMKTELSSSGQTFDAAPVPLSLAACEAY